jgi:transposase-like protein
MRSPGGTNVTTSLRFPMDDLLDEARCYAWLVAYLHPEGLQCPCGHARPPGQAPHTRDRAPIVEYRCRICDRVYNVFTDTVLNGIRYACSQIVLMLRGFLQGTTTAQLADELGLDYDNLLAWRHHLQATMSAHLPPTVLADLVVEADELDQNAGEKGIPHRDPAAPPRRRANKRRGLGTFATDRVPIAGTVGRATGEIRLAAVEQANAATLEAQIDATTCPGATVNTDESAAYRGLAARGHPHPTVCHSAVPREWARDDDGDGVREVHCNTAEGIWTGLRNFLRPFRGISKYYLLHYVALFAAVYNTALALTPSWLAGILRCSSPEAG